MYVYAMLEHLVKQFSINWKTVNVAYELAFSEMAGKGCVSSMCQLLLATVDKVL